MKKSVKKVNRVSKKPTRDIKKKRSSRKKPHRQTKKRITNLFKFWGGKKKSEEELEENKDLENYTANYFFDDETITNQPNSDASYKECGIVHLTESQPINAFRGLTTGIANFFGNKGFDNPIFDYTRNEALQKIKKIMEEKKIDKICNLRMDVDNSDKSLFVINLFGTALRKSDEDGSELAKEEEEDESPKEDEEESESPKEEQEESESPKEEEDESESPKDEEDESESPKDEEEEEESPKEEEEESPKENESPMDDESGSPKEDDIDTPKTWRPKN
jgi:hypothetical protein